MGDGATGNDLPVPTAGIDPRVWPSRELACAQIRAWKPASLVGWFMSNPNGRDDPQEQVASNALEAFNSVKLLKFYVESGHLLSLPQPCTTWAEKFQLLELRVEVRGELAGILALAGSKKPAAELRDGLEQIKVVAGARNHLCRTSVLWFRHVRSLG